MHQQASIRGACHETKCQLMDTLATGGGVLVPLLAESELRTAGVAAVMADVLCAAEGPAADASAMRRSTLPMASVMVLPMLPLKECCCLLLADGRLPTETEVQIKCVAMQFPRPCT